MPTPIKIILGFTVIWVFGHISIAHSESPKHSPFDYIVQNELSAISLSDPITASSISVLPLSKPQSLKLDALAPIPVSKPSQHKEIQQPGLSPSPEPKVASVPIPHVEIEPMSWRLELAAQQASLSEETRSEIQRHILPALKGTGNAVIQILSYASANSQAGSDRRTALARLLEFREILIENGISPARIDIQALGNDTDIKPIDRIDLFVKPKSG